MHFMIILHLELSLFRILGRRRTFSESLQTRHFPDRQTHFLWLLRVLERELHSGAVFKTWDHWYDPPFVAEDS
jgi:hypothetical protein